MNNFSDKPVSKNSTERTNTSSKNNSDQPQSNSIQVPSITLPKGSGSVKFSDKKFPVNSSKGRAPSSIPVSEADERKGTHRALNVIIADDHQLFRIGLRSVLSSLDFVSKIQEAENGKQVIEEMTRQSYEVILMDINMPVMNGTDATRIIKRDFPEVKVIAVTMFEDQKHVIEMIEVGASGYVVKNTDTNEIKNALLKVMNNELYFSNQISECLIKSLLYKHKAKRDQYNSLISTREKEILYLICQEHTTKQIAESLYLSEKTIDWHRQNLLQKTDSKNTAGLVLYALRCGLIEDLVN